MDLSEVLGWLIIFACWIAGYSWHVLVGLVWLGWLVSYLVMGKQNGGSPEAAQDKKNA
jgi:hypothetical protein